MQKEAKELPFVTKCFLYKKISGGQKKKSCFIERNTKKLIP